MTATETALPGLTTATFDARIRRVRAAMAGHGVDGLLVSSPIDIRYVSGFVGDESLALVGPDRVWVISDSRYDEQLVPWREFPGVGVEMGIRHRLEFAVADVCRREGIDRLGIQAERMTIAQREQLDARLTEAGLPADRVKNTTGLLATLRMRKDEAEIAAIERAIRIAEDGFRAALAGLRLGMPELEFAALVEFEMKSRGATASSFSPIVGTGANSSRIHHTTTSTPIGRGTLLVDWGATTDAYYCSDLTRTCSLGPWPEGTAKLYPVVLEAQLAAIDACAPGKTCAEIDAVARTIIDRAGYGAYFGHGLGHGLGLEVHEGPYFNDLETERRLEPGMVMTVEPGIYLPGVGGVRIEDDVLITDAGARVLSSYPKAMDDHVVDLSPGK